MLTVVAICGNASAQNCIGIIDSSKNEFCIGSGSITFSNAIASGENVEWITSGDGIFSDKFAQRPTYTPGPGDSARGNVFIYLDVYKDDTVNFCSVLPVVTLHLSNMGTVITPASQTTCTNVGISNISFTSSLTSTTYTWVRDNPLVGGTIRTSGTATNIAPIKGTLVNNAAAPVLVKFTVTPKASTCDGTPVTATVLVNPKVTATPTPATQTICSGSNIIPITFTGQAAGTLYSWTRNKTDSVSGIAASGTGNISGILTNNRTVPITVTFTITPTANGCTGTPVTASVTVNPTPAIINTTPALQTICSATAISSIISSGGTVYNWTRNNTTQVTGISNSGSGNVTGTLTNTTSVPVYVTFTVTPTTSTCANRATVVVNPKPVVVATPSSQTICSGSNITNIVLTSAVSGTVFNWVRNNTASVTGISSSGSGNITGNLINNSTTPVTVTFTITPTANGCTGNPITATVTVNPRPTSVIAGNYTICANTPAPNINISLTGTGPWNFTYSEGTAPVTVTGQTSNTFVFTAPAQPCVYTVTALSDAYCAAITEDMTGNAVLTHTGYAITATSGANGTVSPADSALVNCGTDKTYTITPNEGYAILDVLVDGVSQGAVPMYTFTNVTAPHTISASFTATVPSFGITATAGANGNISPAGVTNVSSGGTQAFTITPNNCYQVADVLVDGVSVGAVSTYTFYNVSAAHTISATFIALSYSITATAGANGNITPNGATAVNCGNSQTYNIVANSGFAIQNVLVDDSSLGAITSYTFNNVTSAHTISVSFTAVVNCTVPTISTATTNLLCKGSNTGLITVTTTGGTAPFSYEWFGPNEFTASTKDISNLAAGSYTLTLTANGGCTTNRTVVITEPSSVITATATAGTITCGGVSTTLTVTASGGTGARQYSLNGGTFQAGNTFTVNAAGSPYIVTVRDANLCTVNTNAVIVENGASAVPAQPSGVTGTTYGLCGGGTFTYTVQPVAGATSYTWSVPSGCTITSGQNTNQIQVVVPSTFSGSGTIAVTPRNACGNGTQYRFTIFGVLYYPGTSINGPSSVTPGQANVQYSLPFTAGVTYNWLVPSGASIITGQGTNSITVNFGTSGGNVSVTIVNACGTAPRANKPVTVAAAKQSLSLKKETALYNRGVELGMGIYPNPAKNTATVTFGSAEAGARFEVLLINTVGESLQSKAGVTVAGLNTLQLDLGKYSSGVYFVRLVTAGKLQIQKLVKEK